MKVRNQDILQVKTGVIVHQVNCIGKMGAGLALAIRKKWPKAYEDYMKRIEIFKGQAHLLLGVVSLVKVEDELFVAHLFGQVFYGRSGKYTNYGALAVGLVEINLRVGHLPIYIPYGIGCGLGGGDWKIVSELIEFIVPNAIICKKE